MEPPRAYDVAAAEQGVGADALELACFPRDILRARLNAIALEGLREVTPVLKIGFCKQLAVFNPRPPLPASQIEDWERARRVVLPEDMFRFYVEMDGTHPADDEVGIWPLARVERLASAAPAYAEQDDNLFVFADYLIWSHGYAVRLVAGSRVASPVFLIGGQRPWQVADWFTSFVSPWPPGKCPNEPPSNPPLQPTRRTTPRG